MPPKVEQEFDQTEPGEIQGTEGQRVLLHKGTNQDAMNNWVM